MAFIIYAALYKLAVLVAGVACVAMGYRLFVLGVMPRDGSEVDAQAGDIRLSLKNAAPGTCFAAFGVFLIVAMVLQGNPESRLSETVGDTGTVREVTYRGDGDIKARPSLSQGETLEKAGQLDDAILAYAKPLENKNLPLGKATESLRAIAAVYNAQGRYSEALAYARLANQVQADSAPGIALLARIQWNRRERGRAIELMQYAAELDPSFSPELDRMKSE